VHLLEDETTTRPKDFNLGADVLPDGLRGAVGQ
jgi:hypothetical protein